MSQRADVSPKVFSSRGVGLYHGEILSFAKSEFGLKLLGQCADRFISEVSNVKA